MARTGTKPRPTPGSRRSSSGSARSQWRAVGRRKRGASPIATSAAWLFRPETLGVLLILLAVMAVVWVVPIGSASDVRDTVVEALGLQVFSLALAMVAAGWLIWRRRVATIGQPP